MNELAIGLYKEVAQPLIAVLFALAAIVFFWGVAQTTRADSDKEQGRRHMLWGIIGIVIMLSVFGITSVVVNTLGEYGKVPDPAKDLKLETR